MATSALCFACSGNKDQSENQKEEPFNYSLEQFSDLQILRYKVEGFEQLSLKQKELVYYLSQAALEGRDIMFDQNFRYNLVIRRTLEAIYENFEGDKNTDDYKEFEIYLKRVWFSNGIHHHYGQEKFLPAFSKDFFEKRLRKIDNSKLPLKSGQGIEEFIAEICPIMFDPTLFAKKINQDADIDVIAMSANNYYGQGITQKEVETFYANMKDPNDKTPISYGLNSRLVRENGLLVEKVWKVDGLYSQAIEKIVGWLELAENVAENEQQKKVINTLIKYYKTGDLKIFDQYAIHWLDDKNSKIDFINGFTETYGDPLGIKASWESIVNFKNEEASLRTEIISNNAQWFEDNAPINPLFKKKEVRGVSAKVISVAMIGGDCYPATPIGINLPNSNWIRKDHGSKSVSIENITDAYDKASQGNGFSQEFVWSNTELELMKDYGFVTDNLHTDLHECLGHGSGQLLAGVDPDALKAYGATIEEARADLFGLYFIADPKLIELGLLENKEAYKSEYYKFMMNGLLTQLVRIELGKNIEESHMRNRALIARWVYEKGESENIIQLVKKDGEKTVVIINDYEKMRSLLGQLLAEVQRIKSEGDLKAAKELVENYAIKVDPILHAEILERYKKLNLSPYKGFVNPVYQLIRDNQGKLTNVSLSYTEGYAQQMMRYSKEYSSLPNYNE